MKGRAAVLVESLPAAPRDRFVDEIARLALERRGDYGCRLEAGSGAERTVF